MKVLYSPQVNNEPLVYLFEGEKITVTYRGVKDVFDFTGTPDGLLRLVDSTVIPAIPLVTTTLAIMPIQAASRGGGILSVILLNHIGANATEEERFPVWVEV